SLSRPAPDRHSRAAPTEERLIDFSRRIGPLESHVLSQYHHPHCPEIRVLSKVVENGKPLGSADADSYRHSDISYKARPSRATVLYALEVPGEGGDTHFADTVADHEALSAELRRRLDGRSALHDYNSRNDRLPPNERRTLWRTLVSGGTHY
ncbi:MAG: TauD/TfdA family dioxygenase, partial [SAR324 cluster bacterium]|nr:TauD/TfdA family dioxygenase [SAR324 cluster bacterium]